MWGSSFATGQLKGGFLAMEEASRIMPKQEDAGSKVGTNRRKTYNYTARAEASSDGEARLEQKPLGRCQPPCLNARPMGRHVSTALNSSIVGRKKAGHS